MKAKFITSILLSEFNKASISSLKMIRYYDIIFDMGLVFGLVFFLFDYFSSINSGDWTVSLPTFVTIFGVLGLRLISRIGVMGLSFFLVLKSLIALFSLGFLFVLFRQ